MKKLAIGCLFAAAAFAADPELLKLAMPDARILAGIDIAKVKDTPFGKFAVDQLTAAQDPQYDAFVKASGFDPRESLDEILLSKPDPGERRLLLARGRFDTARILDAAAAAGVAVATYRGVQVLISSEVWLAFLSDSIVAMGDTASVRALVERRDKATGPGEQMASRASTASKTYALWFVSTVPLEELMQGVPSEVGGDALKSGALRSIHEAIGGVNFGDSVRLSADLTAGSQEDAGKLAALLRFIAGAALKTQADATSQGSVVKFGISLSEQQLETLFKQAK